MGLVHLDIIDFRNLASVKIEPLYHGFNFIYGHNGSGKTSLLEAIYYLSVGRSFRSSVSDRIIANAADKLSIFANIAGIKEQNIPVGLERQSNGDIKIRIHGDDIRSVAALAELTPVQLMDASCHHLLDSGPSFRRKYLDWGVFYSSNDFLRVWKQFERALKQRNAALRNRMLLKEIASWTHELVDHALFLDQLRRDYVAQLIPILEQTVSELLMIPGLEICYQPGWDQRTAYAEVLRQSIDKDLQLGYTHWGPHKADLSIAINGTPAKDILSRGQQKLFVCAMIIARGTVLKRHTNKRPIYLVDDLPSELDMISRSSLITLLTKQDAQIFITAVERKGWDQYLQHNPVKMFHVEHGKVVEVH